MSKRKFAIFSGFLGSGKTTSMIAVSNELEKAGLRVALIANDLGNANLVDGMLSAQSCSCSETIAGGCICYQTEVLVDRIKSLTDVKGAKLVISDIPGCGVGALDHVYFKLAREYPDEFTLAPFTVICDPLRLRVIMPGERRLRLPEEMDYLFRTQLAEADVIVLNKTDTISEAEKAECVDFIKSAYPGIPVFAVCARSSEGIAELGKYLMENEARLVPVDTGYGGAEFLAAEGTLSWYDRKLYIKSETPFDGNKFALFFSGEVAKRLRAAGGNVPHLKLYATDENNDYLKLSQIDIDCDAELDKKTSALSHSYKICVNARAACPSKLLDRLMDSALSAATEKFGLFCQVFSTECFGMTDEGV